MCEDVFVVLLYRAVFFPPRVKLSSNLYCGFWSFSSARRRLSVALVPALDEDGCDSACPRPQRAEASRALRTAYHLPPACCSPDVFFAEHTGKTAPVI